jgi:hypothetical protein
VNLKTRIQRPEGIKQARTGGQVTITIDVLDRVVNDRISDQELARYLPFFEELFSDARQLTKSMRSRFSKHSH